MDYPIQSAAQLTEHLKSLRSAKGMSQASLGKLLGLGQVRIAGIEKNPGAISVDQLIRILQLLDTRLALQVTTTADSPEAQGADAKLEW